MCILLGQKKNVPESRRTQHVPGLPHSRSKYLPSTHAAMAYSWTHYNDYSEDEEDEIYYVPAPPKPDPDYDPDYTNIKVAFIYPSYTYTVRQARSLQGPVPTQLSCTSNNAKSAEEQRLPAQLREQVLTPTRCFICTSGREYFLQSLTCIKDLSNTKVLWFRICGHGSTNPPTLTMRDTTKVTMPDIASALSSAGFNGTLVISLHVANVHPNKPDTMEFKGTMAKVPFPWVMLCLDDAQSTSLAFSALLEKLSRERPLYTRLKRRVEELWGTFDAPIVLLGGCYGGRFLGPAAKMICEL